MNIEQRLWTPKEGWVTSLSARSCKPQLVFVFGDRKELEKQEHFDTLKSVYPEAHLLICSSAGEIYGTEVRDGSLSVTAIEFEKTTLAFSTAHIERAIESEEKGKEVALKLPTEGLVHAMVFSDGLKVNGTALVSGLTSSLPPNVVVTGGLVGDGADFKKTVLGLDAVPTEGTIVLVGFYGPSLKVGHGSLGGWDPFGPERVITRAKDNVLYELDERPALDLYKEYLGEKAAGLPGTGLLFPLSLRIQTDTGETEVVRTLLAVDEKEHSMTFAGDMPEGSHATLMKANFERLVDGAAGAAKMSKETLGGTEPEFALLISCIGRKLVLKEGVEEETEAVWEMLGKKAIMAGFYSYGEISPVAATEKQCRLHNQTMTITTFREV